MTGGVSGYEISTHWIRLLVAIASTSCVGIGEMLDDRPTAQVRVAVDGDEPSRPVFVWSFSAPVQLDLAAVEDAFTLAAGTIRAPVRARYSVVDRELRVFVARPLRAGLVWQVELERATIRSEAGAEPTSLPSFSFRIDELGGVDVVEGDAAVTPSERLSDPARADVSFERDVRPLLEASCASCHGREGLVALDARTLRSARSVTEPDSPLVRPGDPLGSVLLRRVVPEVHDRFGTVMPPPWSGQEPLALDELRVIETWIFAGARP